MRFRSLMVESPLPRRLDRLVATPTQRSFAGKHILRRSLGKSAADQDTPATAPIALGPPAYPAREPVRNTSRPARAASTQEILPRTADPDAPSVLPPFPAHAISESRIRR